MSRAARGSDAPIGSINCGPWLPTAFWPSASNFHSGGPPNAVSCNSCSSEPFHAAHRSRIRWAIRRYSSRAGSSVAAARCAIRKGGDGGYRVEFDWIVGHVGPSVEDYSESAAATAIAPHGAAKSPRQLQADAGLAATRNKRGQVRSCCCPSIAPGFSQSGARSKVDQHARSAVAQGFFESVSSIGARNERERGRCGVQNRTSGQVMPKRLMGVIRPLLRSLPNVRPLAAPIASRPRRAA